MTDRLEKNTEIPVGNGATSGVANADVGPAATARAFLALTSREREVLALRCDYFTGKEIARLLGIDVRTVHTHLRHCRNKFQARSSGELFRRARLMGICA